MNPKFNIDRPKVSDEEIKKNQNFDALVEQFKKQSLKKARGDESWWKDKKITYSTVIAGITVVCTITYLSIINNQTKQNTSNETLTTHKTTKTVTPKKAFITEPSKTLKVPYSSYKIDAAKGGTITHSSSSKIKVPKNSFVNKQGHDIVGEVTIEYKEFHDPGDIILGGIPMAYDSAGKKYNLESAGMFDIRGYQNGEPVFIKEDKKLQVELASATAEDRFNQYYLDTIQRNWQYLKRDDLPVENTKIKAVAVAGGRTSAPLTSPKTEQLKRETEVIIPRKVDSVKTVYTQKIEKLPTPKEPAKPAKQTPGRPTFRLDGSYNEFPELAAFDNVIWEVGTENKNYTKDMLEITWSDVKINPGPVKGKNYVLTLTHRNRNEKLIVYPVLSAEEFVKAEKVFEKKFETYQQLVEKREADEKRLIAEMEAKQAAYLAEQKKKQQEYENEIARLKAQFDVAAQNELTSNFNAMSMQVKARRIFEVSRFGIFNSDAPHPVIDSNPLTPIFVNDEKEKILHPDRVFLVDHDTKSVYTLDPANGFHLNYRETGNYSLCAFRASNVFICSKAKFREATVDKGNKFLMKESKNETGNVADFKKLLEI